MICNSIIFWAKNIPGYLSYLSLAMFRWLLGDSSNKFQGTEVLINPSPIEIFLISAQRFRIFHEAMAIPTKFPEKHFGIAKLKSEI